MSEVRTAFTEQRLRTVALKCDGCGAVENDPDLYIHGGLLLIIGGGFRSAKPGPDCRMDLCSNCAQKLIALFPAIARSAEQPGALTYICGHVAQCL